MLKVSLSKGGRVPSQVVDLGRNLSNLKAWGSVESRSFLLSSEEPAGKQGPSVEEAEGMELPWKLPTREAVFLSRQNICQPNKGIHSWEAKLESGVLDPSAILTA